MSNTLGMNWDGRSSNELKHPLSTTATFQPSLPSPNNVNAKMNIFGYSQITVCYIIAEIVIFLFYHDICQVQYVYLQVHIDSLTRSVQTL